jgi:hypothetical protein
MGCDSVFHLLVEQPDYRRADPLEPVLDVDGPDDGLEHVSEHAGAPRGIATPTLGRGCVLQHQFGQAHAFRHLHAAGAADDERLQPSETPLLPLGVPLVQGGGDRKTQNAVAQELEALVRAGPLPHPGGMRERALQEVERKSRHEVRERLRPRR